MQFLQMLLSHVALRGSSLFIRMVWLALAVGAVTVPAWGQGEMVCAGQANNHVLRAEGYTEKLGDITILCTGGTPTTAGQPVPSVNVTVIVSSGNITSKITDPNPASPTAFNEALLLIDEPNTDFNTDLETFNHPVLACGSTGGTTAAPFDAGNPGVCTITADGNPINTYSGSTAHPNVFQGRQFPNSGNSTIQFLSVPLDPPGVGRIRHIRITNVRVNAVTLTGGIVAGAGTAFPVSVLLGAQAAINVLPGTFGNGLVTTTGTTTSPFSQSSTGTLSGGSITQVEGLPSAFRPRNWSQIQANGTYIGTPDWLYTGGATPVVTSPDLNQNVSGVVYPMEGSFLFPLTAAAGDPSTNPPEGISVNPGSANAGSQNFQQTLADSGLVNVGTVSQGDRLRFVFANIPTGSNATVPAVVPLLLNNTNTQSGVMVYVSGADANGSGGAPNVAGTTGTGEVALAEPGTTVIYEIIFSAAFGIESVTVPVTLHVAANSAPHTCSTATGSVGFGAFFPSLFLPAPGAPQAMTATSPLPRFSDLTRGTVNLFSFACPDLTITKTHLGEFSRGQQNATYTISVANSGGGPTTGTVTVTDTLPAGLTATALSGTGWNCTLGTLTCTRADALAGSTSYPPITLTVNVANDAAASITNSASVSGGADSNTANNTANDITTVNASAPDLSITKTHTGTFVRGQGNATYTITVTNSGTAATTGQVTVTDSLPASLTLVSIGGSGWTCAGTSCSRTSTLAAGASYPVITLVASVAADAPATITNSATVTGGGDTSPGNNTANDPATVRLPDLTITKTHNGSFLQGQHGVIYTMTVTNSGNQATAGAITVVDTLPAGLTATAMNGPGWSCSVATLTCVNNIIASAGASLSPISLTVNVNTDAATSLTNVATVSGGGEVNTANNTASDPTTINVPSSGIDLVISKTHVGNFRRTQQGAEYTITVTNIGSVLSTGNITVQENLPAGLALQSISGTGWACNSNLVRCTYAGGIATGQSSFPIRLTVIVAGDAPNSVINNVVLSGGGDTHPENNTANDATVIEDSGPIIDLVVSKTHVGNFAPGQIGATYTLTVTNIGAVASAGSVSVVDTLPAGLTVTSMTGSGWACLIPSLTCLRGGVLAPGASFPPITLTVNVAANAPASVTNVAKVSGGGDPNPTNNTTSDVTSIVAGGGGGGGNGPDLTISKSHSGNFAQGQNGATYSVTVTNSGDAPTTGTVTVQETVPTGMVLVSMAGTGWTCSGSSCTRSSALTAGNSYPVITVSLNVTANAPANVTNTVTVSGGGETNTSNNTANDPTTINPSGGGGGGGTPDMTITKSHTGNFTQGQAGATYTLTVTNVGNVTNTGTVTVTEIVPGGLTLVNMSGVGWTCAANTCSRITTVSAGGSYPVISVVVNVAANAPASVTNTVTVSGGGQTNTANDTANDPTTIVPSGSPNSGPDVTISKTHTGNFTPGQVGATYTITVSNVGTSNTSGLMTVVEVPPAALTITAMGGAGWTCVLDSRLCLRSGVLAPGASSTPLTVTVNVAGNAPATVVNTATVTGGGDKNATNNSANDPTAVTGGAVGTPDLTITKTHVGNFTQGQNGAAYSVTVSNVGSAASNGAVTVTDTIPAGLTLASMSGTGWACGANSCTRNDALGAGTAYPVITVTVNVAANATASVTNTVNVSGGGETNTANNAANDVTTVVVSGGGGGPTSVDITVTKTHIGNFHQGQTGAAYTILVSNVGTAASSGLITVIDTLPAGLTATSITGTGWTCVQATLICLRSGSLAAGASHPPITISVTVAANAPASVTNTVSVSGGKDANASNNTASDVTTITGAAAVSVGVFHDGTWMLDSNQDGAFTAGADRTAQFGQAGDVPLTGDWTGKGSSQLGLYRPSTGEFLLDLDGDGQADRTLQLGVMGTPVTGDWNGSGTTKVGIFRDGTWTLDSNGDGRADMVYQFGTAGDSPVAGDWNGTGTAQLGVYRNGVWTLDRDGDGRISSADEVFNFGQAGDVPLTGDWSGTGFAKPGLFRAGFLFVLDEDGNHVFDGARGASPSATDSVFTFGEYDDQTVSALPVTGRW